MHKKNNVGYTHKRAYLQGDRNRGKINKNSIFPGQKQIQYFDIFFVADIIEKRTTAAKNYRKKKIGNIKTK